MDNATQPDVGQGPWNVRQDEANGFYYLTNAGQDDGRKYPLGKTAYRTARKLNEAGGFLEDTPEPPKAPKAHPAIKRVTFTPEKPAAKAKPEPTPQAKAGKPTHSTVTFQGTREEWLNAFVAAARPTFKERGFELPEKIRVSVGFMFRSAKAVGQCWSEEASADGTREIFVIPKIDDSETIAAIVTHELCNTLYQNSEKHGANFKKAFYGVGMAGKATQCAVGDEWHAWADTILKSLGPIPHAAIDPGQSGVKKQTTRLLKAECGLCGFTFRATAKWVNGKSLRCPDYECEGDVLIAGEGGEGEG